MRQPQLRNGFANRSQISAVTSWPAPVGGWNARDSLAAMKPQDAVSLINFMPKTSYCEIRGGSADHVTGIVGNTKTLAVYNALSGSSKMFASTNEAVWDATSPGSLTANYSQFAGAAADYISTPDSAAASVLGDIDIRVKAALTDWTPAAISTLVAKSEATANQRSYAFSVKTDGKFQFQNSPDGTAAALVTSASSVAPTISNGAIIWARVTVDVNDGAGNNVVKFYTSTDYDPSLNTGTWTQLGTTVTNVTATSIFDSTALVEVGSRDTGTTQLTTGYIYCAQIFNGIAGTLKVSFNSNDTYAGDTTWPSFATGEVWTVHGTVSIAGNAVASRTNGKHQHVNFGDGTNNYLIMVNGSDRPLYFNGTTWIGVDSGTSPALIGVTTTDIVSVFVSVGRLFFILNNSLSFWYLPAGAAGGTLLEYDLSAFSKKGGYLVAGETWTVDAGNGPEDRTVFVTSEGEAIIYLGNNPSSTSFWQKVGTYVIGRPLGRHCMTQFGGDLVILTQNGAYPLSAAIQSASIDYKTALSNKIEPPFTEAARNYGSTFGWVATLYPAQTAMLVNIPIAEDGEHEQYVMNTITKAWTRFTGWDAEDFAVLNGELYFTTATKVVKAWTGTADGSDNIEVFAKTAFNYFGNVGSQKRFVMFRPVLAVNGSINFLTDIDVDFKDTPISGSATYTVTIGAKWDVDNWDEAYWAAGLEITKEWTSPDEWTGYCASGKIKISTNALNIQWISCDIIYNRGGIM